MHRVLLCLILLTTSLSTSAQDNSPPYIYYYSNALNAFVIERADGSDTHLLGQDMMLPQSADLINGAGWSPDGQWLAWGGTSLGAFSSSPQGAFAVQANGTEQLDLLQAFSSASLQWSPDSQWVLIKGSILPCTTTCVHTTIWLVDMNTLQVVSSLTLHDAIYGPSYTPTVWEDDKIMFYDVEEPYDKRFYYRITLSFNGDVSKQAMTPEEYAAIETRYSNSELIPLDSPSGHYVAKAFSNILTDTQTGNDIPLPRHSRAASGSYPMEARWHPSEEWVLLGSNWRETESRQAGYVTIMSLDGTIIRELSACGFSTTCINWLPDTVDIDDLPESSEESALLMPIRVENDIEFEGGPNRESGQLLVCDKSTNLWNLVQNAVTSEAIFIVNSDTQCPDDTDVFKVFPFALHPDGTIYAANEGVALSAYTALYDAHTGEQLVVLPTFGWELAFSDEGTELTMRTQNARMVWDIDKLLNNLSFE